MRRAGSNHDNHRRGLHGIQHAMDYYLYMFCVDAMCSSWCVCLYRYVIIILEFNVFVCH